MPYFWDYIWFFEPALNKLLSGGNPYDVPGFFSPVQVLVPLIPLRTISGTWIMLLVLAAVILLVYIQAARRLNKSRAGTLLMVGNFYVAWMIISGNAEWVAWLGVLMPLPLGMVWLVTKPQTMAGYIIYRLWRRFTRRGLLGVLTAVLPVLLVTGWGVWRYGLPRYSLAASPCINTWWPWTMIGGAALLVVAFVRRDARFALASGPLFSPHVCFYSRTALLMPFEGPLALVVMVATWGHVLLKR